MTWIILVAALIVLVIVGVSMLLWDVRRSPDEQTYGNTSLSDMFR